MREHNVVIEEAIVVLYSVMQSVKGCCDKVSISIIVLDDRKLGLETITDAIETMTLKPSLGI